MVGCAWSAPFTLDCPDGLIREGSNSLRIEVTNLPANRIRQMDIDGAKWRIFGDVNILDIMDGKEGRSDITSYASWQLMPSGLCSPVQLVPLQKSEEILLVEQVTFAEEGYSAYPVYRMSIADGTPVVSLSATGYDAYSVEITADGAALVTLRQQSDEYIPFVAVDANGKEYRAYMKAFGAYRPVAAYDFTSTEAPLCGWNSNPELVIRGFEQTGKVPRFVSKKSGKVVSEMYDGLTFTSELSNYFYFYPGYGMNIMRACELTVEANEGAVAMMSYLIGDSEGTPYQAADSLVTFRQYDATLGHIAFELHPLGEFYIYRRLSLYEPQPAADAIADVENNRLSAPVYYDLQGRRIVKRPSYHGIFIDGRKKRIAR